LVDSARDVSGAGTRLIISGSPGSIDEGVELAAYRIVQEALTNARRHAPGCAVDVELGFGDRDLRVRVRDNGPGVEQVTATTGHGLVGMRERAAAVGGTLRAGAAVGSGFVVEAVLPLKRESDR
jgi:signal transduction histidine kinase